MKSFHILNVCVLLLLVCARAQEINSPEDVQAIKDINAAWDKAWNAGNCEVLASLYTADAMAMGPNHTARIGRDAIQASCKRYFNQFREENRSVVKDVRVSGNLAVARGTQDTKTWPKAGGNSVEDKAKWVVAFQRQPHGPWKILWEIYNSDLPLADSPLSAMSTTALAPGIPDAHARSTRPDGE